MLRFVVNALVAKTLRMLREGCLEMMRAVVRELSKNGNFVRSADLHPPKMLRHGRMAGLVKLRRGIRVVDGRRLWVAPALQVFSGDMRGHFRQYCRLSGLCMFWHCLHWP
ncbi:MAG: hypothetical protein ABJO05_07735 [Roseibium sp.]